MNHFTNLHAEILDMSIIYTLLALSNRILFLFRTDGQVYRHQGQIRLAAGQVLPAGYTGPLQLASDEVEGFFSAIDPVGPQTVIMSAASVQQPPQGHSTFTGEYTNVKQ